LKHFATPRFWALHRELPSDIQALADRNFAILKENPRHPSLRLKKVGRFWSARVGRGHRAVAVQKDDGLFWFWIGSHSDYDKLIK